MPPTARQSSRTDTRSPRTPAPGFDLLVIGGGWSGLMMLRHALAEGLNAHLVEAREELGGVWRYSDDPDIVTAMKESEMTSSTCLTEMSDFPMPDDEEFLRHDRVAAYLDAFCARYGLLEHVSLGFRVERVHKAGGRWQVSGSEGITLQASHLVVCSGLHQQPNLDPMDSILRDFRRGEAGELVTHVGRLKEIPDHHDERVLVIGGGESASDLVEGLTRQTKARRVVWSIRSGQHFFRKTGYWVRQNPITGKRYDMQAFDKVASLATGLLSPAHEGKDGMRWGCKWTTAGSLLAYNGHGIPEWKSDAANMRHFINKSADVLDYVDYERLVPKRGIARCEGRRVYFDDGSVEEVDRVILCTGYKSALPFLPGKLGQTCLSRRFKMVFDNDDPTLAFVGFVRPVIGSIPLIAEQQARWVARVFSGRLTLPDRDSRLRKTERERAFWADYFADAPGSPRTLVDIYLYTYWLGRLTGDVPDLARLWREDKEAWYLAIVGTFSAPIFALNDPSTRELAKARLDHHRLLRGGVFKYLFVMLGAKATRFDGICSGLEALKFRLQRSPRAQALATTRGAQVALRLLDAPRRRFFTPSWAYEPRHPIPFEPPVPAEAPALRRAS